MLDTHSPTQIIVITRARAKLGEKRGRRTSPKLTNC